MEIAEHLEIPPVATFAAVCLWNYKPLFRDEGIDRLENLSTLLTFTGSLDESWFYLTSVAIEARGGPIVPLMLTAISAARAKDSMLVMLCLESFAERLDDLGNLLQRMHENCDPHVFYHHIRPFLAGSKNMAEAGLPNGVIYETRQGDSAYQQFSGGSNAQSPLIQFLDLVLGIEHRPTGQRKGAPAEAEGAPKHNFIHEMREYMTGTHRRFLERVAQCANIREFVAERAHDRALCAAYDACLAMLEVFRNKHIAIVTRYVVVKSREAPGWTRDESLKNRQNLALASRGKGGGEKEQRQGLTGTGGTALLPFLKQARDETVEPATMPLRFH